MSPHHQTCLLLLTLCHISTSQTVLNERYTENTRLSVSDSPYIIESDVAIRPNVLFEIENGVEIIFMDDYSISVYGELKIGCSDIDTSSIHRRGLANRRTFTYIHSNNTSNSSSTMGNIHLYDDSFVEICNAKIRGLQHALRVFVTGDIFVDNCEFIDNSEAINYNQINGNARGPTYAFDLAQANTHEIYDSVFDGNYISVSGTPYISNIRVTNMKMNGYVGELLYSVMKGSTIDGGGIMRPQCVALYGANNNFTNNEITNCLGNAIFVRCTESSITNNVIRDNEIGINVADELGLYYSEDEHNLDIHYNDFIDNTINIKVDGEYLYEFNLNYFGTDNETEIARSVDDVCDGSAKGLVIWWPYYTQSIADAVSLPDAVNIESTPCPPLPLPEKYTTGSVLSAAYFGDITLTPEDSPYYVIHSVMFGEDSLLTIEHGVEIIFTYYYRIIVEGEIDCGCSDISRRQANNAPNRGLVDTTNYVHIYENLVHGRGIQFENGGFGNFCNTKFEGLYYGINDQSNNADSTVHVTNCEFINNIYGISGNGQIGRFNEITNSIFISNNRGIQGVEYVSIDNCFFEDDSWGITGTAMNINNCVFRGGTQGAIYATDTNVTNSQIIGEGRWWTLRNCLWLNGEESSSYFINNNITNCYYGLRVSARSDTASYTLIYNTFFDNEIGLHPYTFFDGELIINYNNFIGNGLAVKYEWSDDDLSMPYNYWGQDNITDPQIISDLIGDACDDNWNYDGVIEFWPWLLSPVISMDELPESYAINPTGRCLATSSPTSSPSATLGPCDCNNIELLRIYNSGTNSICYRYQAHFCNNDVRRFTMSVNEQNCGLSDVSSLIDNIRPDDLMWSINDEGNIQIDDLMDGETFTFCLDSSKVLGTNPSGIIQYRIGRQWVGCRGITNVLPDYCGLS